MSDPGLSIWTVYDHPKDYPHCYVAREWRSTTPTGNIILSADLEMIREMLLTQMGLTCLPRDFSDDPKIVETWL